MASRGLEPSNFGLAVRCHPGSLMTVTARNKARAARITTKQINVSEIDVETAKILSSEEAISSNWDAFTDLVASLEAELGPASRPNGDSGKAVWLNASQMHIGNFLCDFKAESAGQPMFSVNEGSQNTPLADFVRGNTVAALQKWDVVVMSGDGEPYQGKLNGIKRVKRQVSIHPSTGAFVVGGKKQRLGATQDLGSNFTKQEDLIIANWKSANPGKQPPAFEYRGY